MRSRRLIILVALILLPCLVHAQDTSGEVEGLLVGPDGGPIAGARILITGPSLIGPRSAASGSDGRFAAAALPVGVYELRILADGHVPATLQGVVVRLGATTGTGTIVLQPRTYDVEDLVVVADPALVDPGVTPVGGNLRADEFSDLPVDRSYRSLTTLLPQIQASYLGDDLNFAGGTGMENKWYVDGVDVSDPVYGWDAMELPYNFVREVQVRTGGYEAEYRGAQGGVVDVVTRSGGNDTEVEAFGFWLDDQLSSTPLQGIQDPDQGGFSRWDVGAGAGGPVVRDRMWYFVAYNPAFDRQETGIPGQDPVTDETTTHRFAGKLDWRAGERHDLTLAMTGDPSRGDMTFFPPVGTPSAFDNTDPVLILQKTGTVASSLSGRHYLGTNSLLESNLSVVWNRSEWEPRTARGAEEILYYDYGRDVVSGGTMFADGSNWNHGRDVTAGFKATLPLAAHTVKVGAEYRRSRVDVKDDTHLLQSWPNPDTGGDDFFLLQLRTHGAVANRLPAAFVQEEWRLHERLRLQAGLRWSGQYLEDSAGEIAVRITDQWQPRAGFVWMADQAAKAKVFGSWGRFYQDVSLWAPSQVLIEDAGATMAWFDHDPRQDPSGGVVIWDSGTILIDDLRGQHHDEWTLGYERSVGPRSSVTVRGVYRNLREAIEDAPSGLNDGAFVWGNPGVGLLAEFPRPRRDYMALEFTYRLAGGGDANVLASYVLSRNRGNTSGIFGSDFGGGNPNYSQQWDSLAWTVNGHGLLPNDRPHVLKLAGSMPAARWLTVGGTFSWMSGTPLSDFGPDHLFLSPRGSAGRTPAIWDLSLRFTVRAGRRGTWTENARILVDLLHVGSPRKATNLDQWHYTYPDAEGNLTDPSPTYGLATAYQPPFAVRLGAIVGF